jgi:poly(3-hydroxybutyrate) depolymerase
MAKVGLAVNLPFVWKLRMNGRIAISAFAGILACVCQACSRPRNNLAASARLEIREEQVQFCNGSVTLAGTLFLPAGQGRHPAVVLFHGSGPEARTPRWHTGLPNRVSRL